MDLYIGLSVGLLVLIIIVIIIVCCIMQRRKKKKDKRYHELVQLRMDRMESQYARECKEGRI
jgi:Orthoreovirus membrane fusion protein p10.